MSKTLMPRMLTRKESMRDRRRSCDWVKIARAIASEKHPTSHEVKQWLNSDDKTELDEQDRPNKSNSSDKPVAIGPEHKLDMLSVGHVAGPYDKFITNGPADMFHECKSVKSHYVGPEQNNQNNIRVCDQSRNENIGNLDLHTSFQKLSDGVMETSTLMVNMNVDQQSDLMIGSNTKEANTSNKLTKGPMSKDKTTGIVSITTLLKGESSRKHVNFRTLPALPMAPNANIMKENMCNVPVWVKFHDILITVFMEDGLSAIATKLGAPLMLNYYTTDMCLESWCRSSYARAMIELWAEQKGNKLEREMLDEKLMLVDDDDGKPLNKVDFDLVNSNSDSDDEVAYDKTAQFMANGGANDASLYEDEYYDI
ncbi:reverse transcriptase domain-containing protein [Tanacetum coccineum]|uniref:Reverse transcriptase domain-containing protein n=1 Tax=Tanacetum coccineum TaxID=301880 RepID=A0ABQ5C472_9ASTR